MGMTRVIYIKLLVLPLTAVFIMSIAGVRPLKAQQADLALQIQANPVIANSQLINTTAFLTRENKSVGLVTLLIQNQNSESEAENLYVDYIITSDKRGIIWHQYQIQGQSFSLNPGQQIYSSNINALGLPGSGEQIILEGGLTTNGKRLLNDLEGGTNLPPDIYTVTICIYQGGNTRSGGSKIACGHADFGSAIVQGAGEIYLTNPGDESGAGAEISYVYPYFSWSGLAGLKYRLIIVEERANRSPQSLINSALSSAPVMNNGGSASGTLLTYENADVVLSTTSFQYPTAGVQALQSGRTYYWQVFAVLNEGTDEERSSEIWSFSISGDAGLVTGNFRSDIIEKLIGRERYNRLQNEGFKLYAVEIDGEVYTAQNIEQFLEEFNSKIEQDSVSVVN